MAVPYRAALQSIETYKPARSLESVRRELGISEFIKLSGNENNHGHSPRVDEALGRFLPEISRYPDSNCSKLRDALSEKLGIKGGQLLFANGSFELISIAAQTYLGQNDEAIIPSPSFGWYTRAATAAGATPVHVPLKEHTVDLDAVLAAATDKTRVVFLCNPNNPTGTRVTKTKLSAFLEKLPSDVLVAIDEAYIDFTCGEDSPDGLDIIKEYDNVATFRTFSKAYGLASLRIGYAAAQPAVIEAMSKAKLPINVNAAAQSAALAALSDDGFYSRVIEENDKGRRQYYEALDELGAPYIPTQCNFIMFDTGVDSAEAVQEYLKRGILVRGGAEFGFPTWLRVTIGKQEENEKALEVLREIISKRKAGN
jgi:histidinol-phosphate aminotransferase